MRGSSLRIGWLGAALTLALGAGCSSDLPAASLIDKLRVLAVQAEPPEIAPGQSAQLAVLTAEPPKMAGTHLQALWEACPLPPTGLADAPCGIGTDSPSGIVPLAASDCPTTLGGDPALFCSSYSADAGLLGSADSTQVLVTVIVADDEAGGASGCIGGILNNGGIPQNPDHCVVSIKRIAVSKSPSNHNPQLADFSATNPAMLTQPLGGDPPGHWYSPPREDRDEWDVIAHRAAGSAERKPDGTYEALSVSWFTSGGRLDGGRSIYLPPGCNDPAACATQEPEDAADTSWFPPTAAKAAGVVGSDGEIDFWAVIRDDRGGVGWKKGRLVNPNSDVAR